MYPLLFIHDIARYNLDDDIMDVTGSMIVFEVMFGDDPADDMSTHVRAPYRVTYDVNDDTDEKFHFYVSLPKG